MDPATRKWSEMSAGAPASEPGETAWSPAAAAGSDTEPAAAGQRFPEPAAEPRSTADDLWAPPWLRLRADEAAAQAAGPPGHPEALSSPGYGGPAAPATPAYGTPAEPASPAYGTPAEPLDAPEAGSADSAETASSSSGASAAESPVGPPGPASGFATAEQESSQQGPGGTAPQPAVDFAPEMMGPPDYIFGPPAGAEAPETGTPLTGVPVAGAPGSTTPWGEAAGGEPAAQPNAPGVGTGPAQPEIPGFPAGQPGMPGQPPQAPSFAMGAQGTATDPYQRPHGYMPNGIGTAPTGTYGLPGAPLAGSAAPPNAWPPMQGMPRPGAVTPEQPTVVINRRPARSGPLSRRGQLLALGALITALAVAAAAGGLWYHRHSVAQQTIKPAVPSPARPATTKLKLSSKIDNVKTDPKPITEAEIFPDASLSVDGRQFARVAAVVNRHCAYAARGSFARALMAGRCQRVVRATFVDSSKRFVITAGVAALPTKALAKRANRAKRLRRNVWFVGLDGPRGSGARLISAMGGYAYGVVDGRYIIFGYATYANGHTPTGTGPQDHLVASLSRAFAMLAQRPITARAES